MIRPVLQMGLALLKGVWRWGLRIVGVLLFVLFTTGVLRWTDLTALVVSQLAARACETPLRISPNAGALLVVDVRHKEDERTFTSASPSDWAVAMSSLVESSTERARDLVIYVHGFRTGATQARCAGSVLREGLANLPGYEETAPDVVVFMWPSVLGRRQFSEAQRSAARAADYLGRLLGTIRGRRVYLVAHSLGAKVTMEAVGTVPQTEREPPFAGILLIQGAIPATSVRTWTGRFLTRHPGADGGAIIKGKIAPPPIVEEQRGFGEYVVAAAKAEHFLVTTAGGDVVLKQAYYLDELFDMDSPNSPKIPPSAGLIRHEGVQPLAIGSRFPREPIYGHEEVPFRDPTDLSKRGKIEIKPPILRSQNPMDVLMSTEWTFEFTLTHTSFHEVSLDDFPRGWSYDWHGQPLYDSALIGAILKAAWTTYGGLSRRRGPAPNFP